MMANAGDELRELMEPENQQATVVELIKLAVPHTRKDQRNLIYVLSQSSRIGHFGMETQIIRTLFEDKYDRIIILTGALERPGTHRWIPDCAGPKIHFVHTHDFNIMLLGQVNAGMQSYEWFDTLFAMPRTLFLMFYRHILGGGPIKRLELSDRVADRAREIFAHNGVDPDEPFALFHNRTLAYHPEMAYHGYRTATIQTYQASIARLIEAGFRVIRLGEANLDRLDLPADRYVEVPSWEGNDGAADLYVLARCAFGLAQNSGPIWVAAAFGRPVLRTNTPFEHLNLPYNDDISLFKHYRRIGSDEFMNYREILEAGIPLLFMDEDIAKAGVELVENSAEELLAATEEMLARNAGTWRPDMTRQNRFRELGLAYHDRVSADPTLERQQLNFYGYAHPFGYISESFLEANPGFLD